MKKISISLALSLVLLIGSGISARDYYRSWKLVATTSKISVGVSYHRSQDECESYRNLHYKGQDMYKCLQMR